MTTKTFEEQAASLVTESFKDGEASDGAPTAEEQAAAAANAQNTADSDDDADDAGQDGGAEGDSEAEDAAAAAGEGGDDSQAAGEAAAEGEKPEKDAKTAKKGGKPTAAERIGDLTAKMRAEQRRADALQAELEQLKAGKAPKSAIMPLTEDHSTSNGGDTPPDPSQFDYGELDPKYIAALARHETAQALKAQKAEDDKTRQAQAADAKRQEQVQKQDALVKSGVKLYDDFDEVVMQGAREGTWELTPHLGELLLDSEFGPHIAYELAKDPDEAARVAKLSPAEQAKFLGRQEAKFEAAKSSQGKKPKTPQTPPPPKLPKGGSGSNKVGADSTDFAAVERAWSSGAL